MANRNFPSAGKIYSGHVMPVLIDCNFIVDSTNGNGLGIRSLKGPYVQNVFMHTSATPGKGNSNPATPGIPVVNPNPSAGIIVVQLQDKFNRLLTGDFSIVSPVGASQIVTSGLTVGAPYVITVLGDATAADWLAIGVPAGVLPAVGVSFIAASAGHGAATVSRVAPPSVSGLDSLETIGDSNQAIAPATAGGTGAQIIMQCLNAGSLATPANGTVISLSFLLSNSSVMVQGE